jgi:hypothetical protein
MDDKTEGPAGRPEQTFFADPALDRLYGVVWALATEVYVLRDRVGLLEEAHWRKPEPSILTPCAPNRRRKRWRRRAPTGRRSSKG